MNPLSSLQKKNPHFYAYLYIIYIALDSQN